MKKLLPLALLGFSPLLAQPSMLIPGKVIKDFKFDHQDEIKSKTQVGTRKETHIKIEDEKLYAYPPAVAYAGQNKDSKWAKSNMARIHFPDTPKEYIVEFDWFKKKTDDTRKDRLYIDCGHRSIRTTFSRTGTTLLLENHLVGKEAAETSKVLDKKPELVLEDDKWYKMKIEVKGEEVFVQINDHKLYGKDPLIAKNKATSFNLDASGAGFLVENLKMYEAKAFQEDWESKKASL